MKKLYPPIPINRSYFIPVSATHQIYVEESGNPNGEAILFVHGGPGGATGAKHRQYFNPERFRIILFDQRGCGKSQPTGETSENTTQDLVKDIEKIRRKLKIESWTLFGSSWGTTLALVSAQKHPEYVQKLILKSLFLAQQKEIDDAYNPEGRLAQLMPEEWSRFFNLLNDQEKESPLKSYAKRIKENDHTAMKAWVDWDFAAYSFHWKNKKTSEANLEQRKYLNTLSKIESHYFSKQCFLKEDLLTTYQNWKDRAFPIKIIHGKKDEITLFENAKLFQSTVSNVKLIEAPLADHSTLDKFFLSQILECVNN